MLHHQGIRRATVHGQSLSKETIQTPNHQDSLCPSKGFESQHGACPAFDITVILFNQIIQLLILPDDNRFFVGYIGVKRCQRCRVGTTFINGHLLGFAAMTNGFAKEAQRRCGIPFCGLQEGLKYPPRGRDISIAL
jgi:hypothetical protein